MSSVNLNHTYRFGIDYAAQTLTWQGDADNQHHPNACAYQSNLRQSDSDNNLQMNNTYTRNNIQYSIYRPIHYSNDGFNEVPHVANISDVRVDQY